MPESCECENSACPHGDVCLGQKFKLYVITIYGTRLCDDCAVRMPAKYISISRRND